MSLIITTASEEDLQPEVIAMAVPPFIKPGERGVVLLRIQRIGKVYFVQHLQQKRSLGEDGVEVLTDDWTNVAVSKPDAKSDGRMDAFKWMQEANQSLIRMAQEQ